VLDGVTDIATGDFDGDTDTDTLLVGSFGARLWINDGSGTFVDASAGLPTVGAAIWFVDAVDLDHDGALDLLLWGQSGLGIDVVADRVWINQGGAVFADETASFLDGPQDRRLRHCGRRFRR
jgi:hypothetical protein